MQQQCTDILGLGQQGATAIRPVLEREAAGDTWNGRILPVSLSKATASASSTTDVTPSFISPGSIAARSGYLPVLFSLLRL